MTPLVLLLVLGAPPQPSNPPPAPSAARTAPTTEQRALARELVHLVQPEPSYRAGLERMTEQMLPSMQAQAQASGTTLPADFKKRFTAALLEVVPYQELMEWSADLYAERFTASELRELIAFYRTPLGQKISLVLPELMGEVGKKTAGLMPERLPAALRRHGLLPGQQQAQPAAQPLKKM